MPPEPHRTGSNERERIYERAPDPAEAVNRPLEPKSSDEPLHERDEPHPEAAARDPHERLNRPIGEPAAEADSDPYERRDPDDDADRASGTRGLGQGSEDR